MRKYTNFPTHVDNALEKVHGKHINNIQEDININQVDISILHEKVFLDNCIFILRNNPYINYMFNIPLRNEDDIWRIKSNNYTFNKYEMSLSIQSGSVAEIHTIVLHNKYNTSINEFILQVDEDKPRGTTIKYFITNDLNNYFPINPGESLPKKLPVTEEKVALKIQLFANSGFVSPRLFGISLFCKDYKYTIDTRIQENNNTISEYPITYSIIRDILTKKVVQIVNDKGLDVRYTRTNNKISQIKNYKLDTIINYDFIRNEENKVKNIVVNEEGITDE